jgi:hypothetical protein
MYELRESTLWIGLGVDVGFVGDRGDGDGWYFRTSRDGRW